MTRFAIITLLLTLQAVRGETPRLFQEKAFTAASFAEAVNHFIGLGEDAAVQELKGLAGNGSGSAGIKTNERIGWMARVLFESKDGEPLRQPRFGALMSLPYHNMPLKNWPRYPVVLSGSTWFVLAEGYSGTGIPEDTQKYIDYCHKTGVFRARPVSVPSKDQAAADAAALRASEAWKTLKWTDSGHNWSYTLSEERTWRFIQGQADQIAAKE